MAGSSRARVFLCAFYCSATNLHELRAVNSHIYFPALPQVISLTQFSGVVGWGLCPGLSQLGGNSLTQSPLESQKAGQAPSWYPCQPLRGRLPEVLEGPNPAPGRAWLVQLHSPCSHPGSKAMGSSHRCRAGNKTQPNAPGMVDFNVTFPQNRITLVGV